MSDRVVVPERLAAAAAREGREWWLATLVASVEEVATRWSLRVGHPFVPGGKTAWVAPARSPDGDDLVLKLGWRHSEGEHEADGLALWAGDGAVVLHAAQTLEHTVALLIERCRPGTALASRPEDEQDVVVAGLLRRLWVTPPADHRFRPLGAMCQEWADQFEAEAADRRGDVDLGVAREGIELFRSLPTSADRAVVLCTDLHAENVLAARREPWLVIDPKPYVGDPAYDVLQHLLNCPARLHSHPRDLAWRMADLAGVDGSRVLLWLFARCILESLDSPELLEVARRIAPT